MKYLILSLAILSVGSLGFASDSSELPEKIIIKNRMGTITLPHAEHAGRMDCSNCHGATVGKFLPMGKDKGHQTCRECHQQITHDNSCGGCHKRDSW